MTPERLNELLAKLLDGALPAAEHHELLDAASQDPAIRRRLEELLGFEPYLVDALAGDEPGDGFLRRVQHGMSLQNEASFIDAVVRKAASAPVPKGDSGAVRPTRRLPSKKSRRPWALFAGLAAGLILGLVGILGTGSSEQGGTTTGTKKEEQKRDAANEKARKKANQELAEAERRRKELETASPAEDQASQEKRRLELARVKQIEEELRAALKEQQARAPRPEPAPPPQKPNDPPEPVALPPDPPKDKAVVPPQPRTVAAIAVAETAGEGATLVTPEGRVPLKAGQTLYPGQGVETAAGADRVVLVFPDKTRVELSAETLVSEIRSEGGKRLTVAKGEVFAEVAKQPKDQPMMFLSPHGEAKVLGTTLRIVVDSDPKKGMRLEVEEGKVQLKNLLGKTVDVVSGHFAVCAVGADLVAKPIPGGLLGAVGYWKFDEPGGVTALDSSGNGNHGALTGAPKRSAGRTGLALELDGVKDYVSIPHAPNLNPGTSLWTVVAWIKTRGADGTIVFKDNGQVSRFYFLSLKSSVAVFGLSTGDADFKVRGTSPVDDGKWHHLAGVRSAPGTINLYTDGVLQGTAQAAAVPQNPVATNTPLKIGVGDLRHSFHYFPGLIDEVGIYNRALSADEIKRLYQGR